MIRTTLSIAAILATLAFVTSAAAQTAAPVRALGSSQTVAGSTVLIAEHSASACAEKKCTARAGKGGYIGAAPLGW